MVGFNHKKSVQALNFFALKEATSFNKLKAIKLIWLADRYHLYKYGRTITGDSYYALRKGPVPSKTRNILQNYRLNEGLKQYSGEYLSTSQYSYSSLKEPNMLVFSQTDIKVLELIYSKYGHFTWQELSEISHTFPEWEKHKLEFKKNPDKRVKLEISSFFQNAKEHSGLFNEPEETIKLSKAMFDEFQKFRFLAV